MLGANTTEWQSRIASAMLSARTIGKEVAAHLIRHYRGTVLSEKFGIGKAASELGHSSIATMKTFYDHSKLSDAEYLQSVDK